MPVLINQTIRPIPNPSDYPNWFTQAHSTGFFYTRWGFDLHYVWDEGILAMGVATLPGDTSRVPCEIVRRRAPMGSLTVNWHAERTGGPPELPHPNSSDPNLRLARATWRPTAPLLESNGVVRN